eukprot:Platyproteum_vivax@DN5697_c1_g1_i1.p1
MAKLDVSLENPVSRNEDGEVADEDQDKFENNDLSNEKCDVKSAQTTNPKELVTSAKSDKNREAVAEKKAQANEKYKRADYLGAINSYSEAINVCDSSDSSSLAVLYNNRATAHYMIENWEEAVADSTLSIESDNKYA